MGRDCIFWIGFIIFLYKYFDQKPQINIDKHGIWRKNNQNDKLFWEQITAIAVSEIQGQHIMKFELIPNVLTDNKKFIKSVVLNSLDIDKAAFITLIDRLIRSEKEKRDLLIQSFKNKEFTPVKASKNYIIFYLFISVILFYLTKNYKVAFLIYIGVLGIASLAVRWYSYSDKKPTLIKHAATVVYLGFVNLALLLLSFTATKHLKKSTKYKLTTSIERYYKIHHHYPKTIDSIAKSSELNFLETYFLDEFEYKNLKDSYVLQKKK